MAIKKPKRLMGFIEIDETQCPFEFHHDDFKLFLYPSSVDEWKKSADFFSFIMDVQNRNSRKQQWVKNVDLIGITADNNIVVFCALDSPENDRGFISYKIEWYYICRAGFALDGIQGFRVTGSEIDYFYPPEKALNKTITFKDKTRIEKLSVTSAKENAVMDCGTYVAANKLKAKVVLEAFAVMHHNAGEPPIDASSQLVYEFSKPVSYNKLVDVYRQADLFIKYVVYRTNISWDSIDVFFLTADNKRDYAGLLVFPPGKKEIHKDASRRIIAAAQFGRHMVKLLSVIKNKKMGFHHICDSIDGMRHYSPERIIMIMAEFEREYHNIYGFDHGRSDLYHSVKDDIIKYVEQYRKEKSGKSKKYAQEIKKLITTTDNSYAQNVRIALKDCELIILPFIRKKYNGRMGKVVDDICSRAGRIRNGIAHNRLDFKIESIHLSDIKVIEELIYAMRLKAIGLDTKSIITGISQLFGENMVV